MKAIVLSVLISGLCNSVATAEVIHTQVTGRVGVLELYCRLFVSDNSNSDRLSVAIDQPVVLGAGKSLANHNQLGAEGCPTEKIRELKSNSRLGFGFMDATIDITQETGSPILYNGKCIQRVSELLQVDIEGLKLSDETMTSIPSNACGF